MPSKEAKSDYFSHRVAARLDGPVLRYSNRVALLKEAGKLGIGRFEANLLIAKVQHSRVQGSGFRVHEKTTNGAWLGPAAVVVSVQTLIILAVWWLVRL
jgi:hypothetical protein